MSIQRHDKTNKLETMWTYWTYVHVFWNIQFEKNNYEFLTPNLQLGRFPLLLPLFQLFCSFSLFFFQRTLIVEIRTLVAWLKSTILLKIECPYTHIYMKTEYLQTKWDTLHYLGRERKGELLYVIKSLIFCESWKGRFKGCSIKHQPKYIEFVSWYFFWLPMINLL